MRAPTRIGFGPASVPVRVDGSPRVPAPPRGCGRGRKGERETFASHSPAPRPAKENPLTRSYSAIGGPVPTGEKISPDLGFFGGQLCRQIAHNGASIPECRAFETHVLPAILPTASRPLLVDTRKLSTTHRERGIDRFLPSTITPPPACDWCIMTWNTFAFHCKETRPPQWPAPLLSDNSGHTDTELLDFRGNIRGRWHWPRRACIR